jgi:hypothetical protein
MLLPVNSRFKLAVSSPWLISAVAFLLRLAFVFYESHRVPSEALATVPFQNEVGSVAAALAQGKGFCCLFQQPTGATAWLAPVYPFFLSIIFRLFGVFTTTSFYVAASFNCVFSAASCLPLCRTGERIASRGTGLVAAWLWAVFPSAILIPFEWIWDTSLSALLGICLLWCTLLVADRPVQRNFIWYGLFWGFGLITNPALGAVLPIFLVWLYFQMKLAKSNRLTQLTISVLLAILLCIPWTIRNAVEFHRLIPVRSDLPFELWMGNNAIYDEHSRAINRITRYEQVHLYAQLGETAFLEKKGEAAMDFIRRHPALCLKLAGKRAIAFWLGTATPWTDFLRSDSLFLRSLFVWNFLTVSGVMAGLLSVVLARRQFFWPLTAFPLAFPLVYYFTQESLRLRHPCDPVLVLLMALAATWLWWRMDPHANGK